jgi:hypothetical protein
VGVSLVKEVSQSTDGLSLLKGAGLEFAQKLPGRVSDLFANYPKLSTVQDAITAVSPQSMVSDLEKAKKNAAADGEANARKQAMNSDADARNVNF